ncbi:MAG: hypothetical protein HQL36_06690 [Alphaproteobacteria bacterium]|nr:hypothetical protein [Alphaproteobacteria bacterium]
MLVKGLGILVAALGLSLPADVWAQETNASGNGDKDIFWFDQSFKIMTCDLETTDSKCIGDPRTPLCAVETILASSIFEGEDRSDDRLRRVAIGEIPGPIENLKPAQYCGVREGYRVISLRQFLRDSLLPYPGRNLYGVQVGDVAITIEISPGCERRKCPPPDLSDNLSYILRKGPYGWYIFYGDNRYDLTDRNNLLWTCDGWPDGWTGPGPFPEYCPDPPQKP